MLLLLFGCGGRVELEQCAQGDRKGITNRLLRPKGTMEGSLRPCDDDRVKSLSHVQLFVTPWTVAYQASPSVGFSRQEHWSGLPFPPAGDLPGPGIEPGSPALQALSLPPEPPEKPIGKVLRGGTQALPAKQLAGVHQVNKPGSQRLS